MKIKKFSVAFLAFLLAFSGALVPKQVSADVNPLMEKALEQLGDASDGYKLSDSIDDFFNPEEEVRIIVELKAKPGIVIANERDISYESLSLSEKNQINNQLTVDQEAVKNRITSNSIRMEFINSFTVAMNGFSGIVKSKDIKVIESMPDVKKVYLANEYEKPEERPEMVTSGEMVYASQTWALDYQGEEQVIAILDTGIDYTHRDMNLAPGTEVTITEEDLAGLNLKGKYFTKKVPYGYNYYDLNTEIIDKGPDPSMHGQHVAGTAGANGDTEDGGIKGIAPKSQLLAMKVFSNDPIYATTFSDIYLVAIDESIKLGADVINMSLGSTASFYIEDSAENVALQNAVDNGIVAAVSAGNSGYSTYGWDDPWASNPDVGVVGAPGLNTPTIQVASIENTDQQVRYLTYDVEGVEKKAAMALAGPTDPTKLPENVEYAYGGLGAPEDLTEVSGKVALIMRGAYPFTDKISNAMDAGAIGVIVFNNAGDALINMAYPEGEKIPAVFIGNTAGMELMNLETKVLTFTDGVIQIPNPTAGQMSDFSSWGTTPTLELKPEITAPGGQIFSTLNDDRYGIMSGTSMAAPHVAGGSALVMEYVESNPKFDELSSKERSEMVKTILMNTAEQVIDGSGVEISPRSQGAGVMNLVGAVTTPVILLNKATGEAKVELKDFEEKMFTMTFTAVNYSDEEVTYLVDTSNLKDRVVTVDDNDYIGYGSMDLVADVESPEEITVPANGQIDFEVSVDFTDDEIAENSFVEGFVKLMDKKDTNPELVVPYVGFYGDWAEPAIIDGLSLESFGADWSHEAFGKSYFGTSGFGVIYEGTLYFLTEDEIFLNPGTEVGQMNGTDHMLPILSFLRNAEEVNYRITDDEGTVLRNIYTNMWERKDYINGGTGNPYSIIENALWDGTVDGVVVEDGQYVYEITAKIQNDAEYQTYEMPVGIDTTAPVVEEAKYNQETRTVTFKSSDAGVGTELIYIGIDGQLATQLTLTEDETYSFTVPADFEEFSTVNILTMDKLGNMKQYDIGVLAEEDPIIYILNPDLLVIYGQSDIYVEGYVTNVNTIEKVLLNDSIEAEVVFMDSTEIIDPNTGNTLYSGPAFKYTAMIGLEDGYQELSVKAVTEDGVDASLVRRFYVDTTAPVIEAEVTRNADNTEATINFTLSDNLGYMTFFHGDSQLFTYEADLVINGPTEKTFEYKVDLTEGHNEFIFRLVDGAGHETVKVLNLVQDNIERLEGANRYETAVAVSKAQFESATDVVLASGLNFPDALAGAVLAKSVNGPVLLTRNTSLASSTKEELARLGAKNIHILGGESAVSAEVAAELEGLGYTVIRYAGDNRYATAVELGEAVMAKNPGNTVILTNSDDFGELLAANAFAAYSNYPALFTRAESLSASTKQALKDWGIENVIVIGDEAAVSSDVVLEMIALGINVERTEAADRELTSLKVAQKYFPTANKAIIAYGYDYPDALVGGAYAASLDAPILLVNSDTINDEMLSYIEANIVEVTVLGGSSAVSDEVLNAINAVIK